MDQRRKTYIVLGITAVLIFILVWYCGRGGSSATNAVDLKEKETIKLVQNYGTEKSNILKSLGLLITLGQDTSNYKVEVIGWSSYQIATKPGAEIYKVTFTVKEGEKNVNYVWEVDLISKNVYASNKEADDIMNLVKAYK